MKKLSTLLLAILCLNITALALTDPDKKERKIKDAETIKHVEHNGMDFAHHVPLTSFYSTTEENDRLAFALVTKKTDNIRFSEVKDPKFRKRLVVDVYIYDENYSCPNAQQAKAKTIFEWLKIYDPGATLKKFNLSNDLSDEQLDFYSFTASFRESDGSDDPRDIDRRGAQFRLANCTDDPKMKSIIQIFQHDGTPVIHPK